MVGPRAGDGHPPELSRVKAAVIGAGSWGTAVAAIASRHADVALWARSPELALRIAAEHRNPLYLPELELAANVRATSSIDDACAGADVVVVGVPSHGFRQVLSGAAGRIGPDVPVVSLSKGIEVGTLQRMTEVVAEVLPDHREDRIGTLTGPNLAAEVADGQPTASVIAMRDHDTAAGLQQLFMTGSFRVYTNPDVTGCEIAGTVKNVIAIAAGVAEGLGYGSNTQAALVTRGLAEMARLGVALGGDPLTFAGLAGMGDLVATCTSSKSRNRTVGVELGRGRTLDDITAEMRMVAEGVRSTRAVLELARRHGVEMPIAEQVGAVLYEGHKPADLVATLMLREAKPELRGIR
ncbi:MAG: glycerol 3-phosphate dehydrogenase [Actinomycetia bacterium]|nr:glycerol 3-phosphate dehydrogenase [Actinomycetes bacterium]